VSDQVVGLGWLSVLSATANFLCCQLRKMVNERGKEEVVSSYPFHASALTSCNCLQNKFLYVFTRVAVCYRREIALLKTGREIHGKCAFSVQKNCSVN